MSELTPMRRSRHSHTFYVEVVTRDEPLDDQRHSFNHLHTFGVNEYHAHTVAGKTFSLRVPLDPHGKTEVQP